MKQKKDKETTKISSINEFAELIHLNSKAHGFWDEKRRFGEIISLIHSELSEALEEYRQDKPLYYIEKDKPEGIAVELADAIIRILDWSASLGIDMESIMLAKYEFNLNRPFKHGNKKI